MSNEECLLRLYNSYPNARYFTIHDKNKFRYITESNILEIKLDNLELNKINQNIFLLSPIEIYLIIYMLEVLYHNNLSEQDINIITKFTTTYVELTKEFSNSEVNDNFKKLRWNMLSIPVYTADDPYYLAYPASKIIRDILEKDNLNSNARGNARSLKNPNGSIEFDVDEYRNAGFIVLALILGVVAVTITYITTFLINK